MCKQKKPKGSPCSARKRRKQQRRTGEVSAEIENDNVHIKKTPKGVVVTRTSHPDKNNLEDALATLAAAKRA